MLLLTLSAPECILHCPTFLGHQLLVQVQGRVQSISRAWVTCWCPRGKELEGIFGTLWFLYGKETSYLVGSSPNTGKGFQMGVKEDNRPLQCLRAPPFCGKLARLWQPRLHRAVTLGAPGCYQQAGAELDESGRSRWSSHVAGGHLKMGTLGPHGTWRTREGKGICTE